MGLKPDASRFYDGGSLDGSEKPQPGIELLILLKRDLAPKKRRLSRSDGNAELTESFLLQRRIAYRARWRDQKELDIVVPAAVSSNSPPGAVFRSDLTSVPDLFTWLVPRTGLHLPAALVHDGLIYDPGEPASYEALEPVPRIEADRIFRDGMADLGTGVVRRWLMWSAVTLATVAAGVSSVSPPGRTTGADEVRKAKAIGGAGRDRYFRVVVFGSLLIIVALGAVATLDFFDILNVLPWMGERRYFVEFFLGAAFAILISALLSALWLDLWRAGMIAGVALALLLHVTIALAALTVAFQVIERSLSKRRTP